MYHLVMDSIWKMPGEKQSRMTFGLGNSRWSFSKLIEGRGRTGRLEEGGRIGDVESEIIVEHPHPQLFSLLLHQYRNILFEFLLRIKRENIPQNLIAHLLPACIFFCVFVAKLLHITSLHSLSFYFSVLLQLSFLTHPTSPSKLLCQDQR